MSQQPATVGVCSPSLVADRVWPNVEGVVVLPSLRSRPRLPAEGGFVQRRDRTDLDHLAAFPAAPPPRAALRPYAAWGISPSSSWSLSHGSSCPCCRSPEACPCRTSPVLSHSSLSCLGALRAPHPPRNVADSGVEWVTHGRTDQ